MVRARFCGYDDLVPFSSCITTHTYKWVDDYWIWFDGPEIILADA